jgi:hypothetical protein
MEDNAVNIAGFLSKANRSWPKETVADDGDSLSTTTNEVVGRLEFLDDNKKARAIAEGLFARRNWPLSRGMEDCSETETNPCRSARTFVNVCRHPRYSDQGQEKNVSTLPPVRPQGGIYGSIGVGTLGQKAALTGERG